MDTNYILGREQVSLHNASVATSSPARIAHAGLAAAYGALLAENAFPHRYKRPFVHPIGSEEDVDGWENEGGSAVQQQEAPFGRPPRLLAGNNEGLSDATRGHVVQTLGGVEPYKVVLEHESGADTEQSVSSVRAGEQLIRKNTPQPRRRNTLLDRPAPGG